MYLTTKLKPHTSRTLLSISEGFVRYKLFQKYHPGFAGTIFTQRTSFTQKDEATSPHSLLLLLAMGPAGVSEQWI